MIKKLYILSWPGVVFFNAGCNEQI